LAVATPPFTGTRRAGSPPKDVPKTLVYRLCRWRNSPTPVVPERCSPNRPPRSCRPGQLDTDSLPPYEHLDPVLEAYVEGDLTAAELVEAGFARRPGERVVRLVDTAEYKRRQSRSGSG